MVIHPQFHAYGFLQILSLEAVHFIATGNLIRRYKDQGYEFATVTEMMKALGPQPAT